jgi:2-phosphosulfolactate phosphatase
LEQKANIEVCLSPLLFPLLKKEGKVVVVIDILRATSTICTALANGAQYVIPVETTEECLWHRGDGVLLAAERNGQIAEGFEHGNSPLEYGPEKIKDRVLVLTTTNGTKCLRMSEGADHILVGSFLNLDAIVQRLKDLNKDVILFCAGWKDQFNLEDTLFAGAVVDMLKYDFTFDNDAAFAARQLYVNTDDHLMEVVKFSSHYQRLSKHGVVKDIEYCLTPNLLNMVPFLDKDMKIKLS